jgi:hypothetical protein
MKEHNTRLLVIGEKLKFGKSDWERDTIDQLIDLIDEMANEIDNLKEKQHTHHGEVRFR